MNINLNVTITPSPEMSALINTLAGLLTGKPAAPKEPQVQVEIPAVVPTEKKTRKPKEEVVAQAQEETADEVIEKALNSTEAITLEMIQEVSRKKTQEGKKDEVKTLVKDTYGLAKITDLPADKYEAFYSAVKAL